MSTTGWVIYMHAEWTIVDSIGTRRKCIARGKARQNIYGKHLSMAARRQLHLHVFS